MREIGAAPNEVIVFDKSAILPIEDKDLDGFDYTITPTQYQGKKKKEPTPVWVVKFDRDLSYEEKRALVAYMKEPLAEGKKTSRGWLDKESGHFYMRSEEAAKGLAAILDNSEAVADAQPLSAKDYKEAIAPAAKEGRTPAKAGDSKKAAAPAPMNRVDVEGLFNDLSTKGETKLSDHSAPVKPESAPAKPEPKRMIVDDEMRDMEDELRSLLGIDDSEGDRGDLFRNPEDFSNKERMQITSLGITYALKYFDQGVVSFPDFADRMVRRMGEKIRPWLKAFYGGARDIPGYDHLPFTPAEEVKAFDVMNFDKENKDADPMRTAQGIVAESRAEAAVAEAKKEITEQRNQKRKENEKQREADTDALAEKADAVAGEAEKHAGLEGGGKQDRKTVLKDIERIDEAIDDINNQLAILGYFSDDNRIATAEKKAARAGAELLTRLVEDLHLNVGDLPEGSHPVASDFTEKGGYVRLNVPVRKGYEPMRIDIAFERTPGGAIRLTELMTTLKRGDDLSIVIGEDRRGWPKAPTYGELLGSIKEQMEKYLPKNQATEDKPDATRAEDEAYHGTVTLKDGREAVVVIANHEGSLDGESRITDYLVGVKGEPGTIRIKPEDIAHSGAPTAEDIPSYAKEESHSPTATASAQSEAIEKAMETLGGGKKKPAKKKPEVKPEQTVGDLFGGLFDEPIKDEKETDVRPRPGTGEREGGHEPRQDEPVGTSQRNEDGGTDGGGMAGRGGGDTMPDTGRGSGVSPISSEHAVGSPAKAGGSKRDEPVTRLPQKQRRNRNNHVIK